MRVTLRSDNSPDVLLEQACDCCSTVAQLDQHIRALQAARRWLGKETTLRAERKVAASKVAK